MSLVVNFVDDKSLPDSSGKLVLRIDGEVVPFASATMTYALNTIPQAVITLAVGQDVQTLEESPVMQIAASGSLSQMIPLTLHLEGNLGDLSEGAFLPANEPAGDNSNLAVIFTGYVGNTNYRRNASRIAVQVTAVGKLVDFTMSSVGSAQIVPGAPIDFFTSVYNSGAGATTLSPYQSFVTALVTAAQKDDAAAALLQLVEEISSAPQLHAGVIPGLITPRNNTRVLSLINSAVADEQAWVGLIPSERAVDYLKKFELYQAYKLTLSGGSAGKLMSHISKLVQGSIAGGSFWNLLTGMLLPELGMGIIPLARTAIIAPLMPLNKKAAVKITTSEWADSNRYLLSQRPLYGVAVYGTSTTGTGIAGRSSNTLGSYYIPREEATDGAWLFSPLPPWLDDAGNAFRPGAINTGQAVMTDILDWLSPNAANRDDDLRLTEAERKDITDTAQKYAELLYSATALRGRDATLTTKLRFDISPGCTIEYSAEELSGTDRSSLSLFAFVTQVTITIDAENRKSMTTLSLSNVRTAAENRDEGFSLSEHPFFDKYFEYAAIVPELLLPQVNL